MEVALGAGAEDLKTDGAVYEIITAVKDFDTVKNALTAAGIELQSSDLTMVPGTAVPVKDQETARKVLGFIDALEEHDDVNNAYGNFDIPDSILSELAK